MCQMDISREMATDEIEDQSHETAANPNETEADNINGTNAPDISISTIDWNTNFVDVSPEKDGGVRKVVLKEGVNPEHPVDGDAVSVRYVAFYEDGRQFDSNNDNPYEFVIGKGCVIKAWDFGVATMSMKEISVFFCHPDYAYGADGFAPLIPPSANIIFRIEILDWKGEDITKLKDGGIRKSILEKGEDSASPNDGSTCSIHIHGKVDDRIFEEHDVDFVMGEGSDVGIVSGVEYALRHFKKGERSRLHVIAKYAYGSNGKADYGIPGDACLIYDVKLIDFVRAKDHWEMNMSERIQHADLAKERGTKFFKEGKYNLAKKKYKQAVQYLDVKISLESEEAESRKSLLVASRLNLAMCHLKLGDNLSALYSSCLALDLEPTNSKGLYRRGMANLGLGNLSDAIQDFTTLSQHDPQNKAARQQLEIASQKINTAKNNEKFIFGGMFQKFAEQDSKAEHQEHLDVFSNIGEWNNEMAKDMMTLEQEMAAFGELMPAPKYNSRQDGKENENPGSDED